MNTLRVHRKALLQHDPWTYIDPSHSLVYKSLNCSSNGNYVITEHVTLSDKYLSVRSHGTLAKIMVNHG